MIDTLAHDLTLQELDYRSTDGVEVWLLWSKKTNRLTVAVRDERSGDRFELAVDSDSALDAFHHPYAYAAFHGVDYRADLRAPAEPVHA
jgi:hypothetical protein